MESDRDGRPLEGGGAAPHHEVEVRTGGEARVAGRLYTEGLFAHVRHINYSGDVLLFSGIALVAHHYELLWIPLGMAFGFLFWLVPLKESYLRTKYGQEFEDYAARTKMLIPLIV